MQYLLLYFKENTIMKDDNKKQQQNISNSLTPTNLNEILSMGSKTHTYGTCVCKTEPCQTASSGLILILITLHQQNKNKPG
jgi:hypothetical protein